VSTNQELTNVIKGKEVDSVRQRGADLDIDFEDGSTMSVKLADAQGTVTVEDDDGNEHYSS